MICNKNPLKFSTIFYETSSPIQPESEEEKKRKGYRSKAPVAIICTTINGEWLVKNCNSMQHDAVIIRFIVLIQIANKAFPICLSFVHELFPPFWFSLLSFSSMHSTISRFTFRLAQLYRKPSFVLISKTYGKGSFFFKFSIQYMNE